MDCIEAEFSEIYTDPFLLMMRMLSSLIASSP